MPGQFEETKHARGGKGSEKGGQFVAKGAGGGGGAAAGKPKPKTGAELAAMPEADFIASLAEPPSWSTGGFGAAQPGTNSEDAVMLEEGKKQRRAIKDFFGITPAENEAISAYQGSFYGSINSGLREGHVKSADARKYVQGLDQVFEKIAAKGGVPKAITVFRGTFPGLDDNFDAFLESAKAGDMMFDEGFVSTSMDPKIAEDFSLSPNGYLFEITVPKGTPALPVNDITGQLTSESELLLPRAEKGASFRVKNIVDGPPGKKKFVMDYVYLHSPGSPEKAVA